MDILFIKIGNRIFGLRKELIMEVVFPEIFFEVPGVPAAVKGVINNKGKPVVVLNTPYLLNTESNKKDGVVICKAGEFEFGILVDSIELFYTIPEKNFYREDKQMFDGKVVIKNRKYYILGLDNLLNHKEIIPLLK
ncbi:chemotaxis protein CheW [candidate division KSB1 bacterium]